MYTLSFFKGFTDQKRHTPARPARRRTLFEAIAYRNEIRRQLRHTEELSDYLLQDIGLTRSDLRRGRE